MDRSVDTGAVRAGSRRDGPRAPVWVRIDLANGVTAALIRFERSDGTAVERPFRGRRMMLRPPDSVSRILACDPDGRPLPEGRWTVTPVGAVCAFAASLGSTLADRVRRPGALLASLRTAAGLAVRGEWREMARRMRGPGAIAVDADPGPSRWRAPHAWAPRADGPPRVLCVTPGLALDGATLSLAEMSAGLARMAGWRVEVLGAAEGPALPRFAGVSARIDPSIGAAALDLRAHDAQIERIRGAIRAGAADIVVANTVRAFGAVEAAWRAGVPSIWIIRESEPWPGVLGGLHGDVQARARAAFDLAWRVAFVADATRASWRRVIDDGRVATIHNALADSDAFRDPHARVHVRQAEGWTAEEVVVLSVGAICRRKAQADLLAAFGRLDASVASGMSVLLVGSIDPDYAATFQESVSALPGSHRARVRVRPPTEAVGAFYAASDIYVGCSIFESYPRTILEALAAGMAIVTTPVFGVREQVEEDRSALFFAPGDTAALAQHLARLARDGALRDRLRAGARARAAALPTHGAMIDAYAALVREAVAMRGA